MNKKERLSSVPVLIAVVSLLLISPLASAQQSSDDQTLRGKVNSAGEFRDQSGRVVGRIMMSAPGATFDISTMNITGDGTVTDSSGAVVGKLMLGSQGSPGSPVVRAAPPVNVNPAPQTTRQYQPELVAPGHRYSQPLTQTARPPASAPMSEKRRKKAVVMGMRAEDLNARCAKVKNRIDSDLAEGRITEEQASVLQGELQSTIDAQANFERRGIIKDRDVTSLYKRWDHIMEKEDEDLAHNARSAIGLRTK
jgi:hypothetical protein